MTGDFKDHFSDRAAAYAAYRPHYPASLGSFLANLAPAHDAAWDVGCGSGQMSTLLGDHFRRVIATDPSSAQLARAVPHPNVEYVLATAEQTNIQARSIDLISVAQAAHWFDLPRFYMEVRRVAKPGAVLAMLTYAETLVDSPVGQIVDDFYSRVLGKWWPPERRHTETGYRDLDFPFEGVPTPELEMSVRWTVEEFLGYVNTWSAVRAMEASQGRGETEEFERRVREAWRDDQVRRVYWPVYVRAGVVR